MKQKTIFKILAISMILVLLLLNISTLTYAAITQDTNTGTITVNGVEDGARVSLYKLTNVNYDYDNNKMDEYMPYAWTEEAENAIYGTSHSEYSDINVFTERFKPLYETNTDGETISVEERERLTKELKDFYDELRNVLKGTEPTYVSEDLTHNDGDNYYSVTFDSCEMGTYLISVDEKDEYNPLNRIYQASVVNLIPKYTGNDWILENSDIAVNVKSKVKPSIIKTVTDFTKKSDNYGTNDTIPFNIVVPLTDYYDKTLKISDILGEGLFIDGNITVGLINGYNVDENMDYVSTEIGSDLYTITDKCASEVFENFRGPSDWICRI